MTPLSNLAKALQPQGTEPTDLQRDALSCAQDMGLLYNYLGERINAIAQRCQRHGRTQIVATLRDLLGDRPNDDPPYTPGTDFDAALTKFLNDWPLMSDAPVPECPDLPFVDGPEETE